MNTTTGRVKSNPLPPGFSDLDQANEFTQFFSNKIDNIRKELDSYDLYTPHTRKTDKLTEFRTLPQKEVKDIIVKMQTKSCELDVIPTKLLKENLTHILPIITGLVNLSLQQGSFIDDWKYPIVHPLIKKLEIGCIRKKYRPVSNLQFISKIVECAMLREIIDHCDQKNLHPDYQSAYRKLHGCEMAVIKLLNEILWDMENKRIVILICIDLSVAFDTVDHTVLLQVMHNYFVLSGKFLK